jgi:hypothetical protein
VKGALPEQSTIATALEQHLLQRKLHAFRLDGDNVRFGLNKVSLRSSFLNLISYDEAKPGSTANPVSVSRYTPLGPRIWPYRPNREHPPNRGSLPPLQLVGHLDHHGLHLAVHL